MELNDVDIEILNTLGKFKCEEYINANKATTFNLPNLREAGFINAKKATTVNLPNLQKARFINAPYATTLKLPNLQEAEFINASYAKKIIIPSHLKNRIPLVPDDCKFIHPDLEATPKLESFKTFFYK